ncbi:unnamed protein product, partial [marine sediment metagenome]
SDSPNLDDQQVRLLVLIYSNANNFDLHYKTIMDRLGWSRSKVKRIIKSLKVDGVMDDHYNINLRGSPMTIPMVTSDPSVGLPVNPITIETKEEIKEYNKRKEVGSYITPDNIEEVNHEDLPF